MSILFRPGLEKPALNLSFLGASLPTGVTLTRGSAGTYFDSAGLMQSASTNVARFDYGPSPGSAPLGLLLEKSATNVCVQSQNFGTTWSASNVTVGINNIVSPSGATDADTLSATGADSYIFQAVSVSNGTAYNARAWFKATTSISADWLIDTSAAGGPYQGGSKALTTSWAAFDIPFTSAATTVNAILGGNTSFTTGEVAHGWGVQIETGSYPTSYIATTTASVTRSADVATITRTGVSKGGVVIRARTAAGAGTQVLWQWDDGSENNRLTIYRDSSNAIHFVVRASSSTSVDITLATVAANTNFAVGVTWSANDCAACLNAGSVTTDTSATIPTGLTTIRLGASSSATSWDGHYRTMALYEGSRVPDHVLQNRTGAA